MKTLILTDMHNEDPFDFLSEQREKGIEKFVCLGDCDNPSIVKRILELDIEKRFAVGNHDFFLACGNWMKVLSRHLYQDPRMLATEWNVIYCDLAKAIREYGQKTFQPQIGASVTEKVAGRNVFYAHGGFSLEDPLICMEQNLITGHAVRDYAARLKCFADMRKNDCWLFFRGHDHVRQVWSMDEHSKTISWHVGSKIRLDPCLRYIVTFGSFSADMRSNRHEYAVFDEENRTLCFGTKNILEI